MKSIQSNLRCLHRVGVLNRLKQRGCTRLANVISDFATERVTRQPLVLAASAKGGGTKRVKNSDAGTTEGPEGTSDGLTMGNTG